MEGGAQPSDKPPGDGGSEPGQTMDSSRASAGTKRPAPEAVDLDGAEEDSAQQGEGGDSVSRRKRVKTLSPCAAGGSGDASEGEIMDANHGSEPTPVGKAVEEPAQTQHNG